MTATTSATGARQIPQYDLARLTFPDAVVIGQHIRAQAENAVTATEAAQCIVDFLFASLDAPAADSAGAKHHDKDPCVALLRCFLTQPFSALPHDAFAAARAALPSIGDTTSCLTLLATRGIAEAWNTPGTSTGHRAIPLANVAMVERAPMIARLISEVGITSEELVNPKLNLLIDQPNRSFNVFFVENAHGSAFIPAQQDFVEPYDIRSVIGMGGLLASGELFAMILFTKVAITREVAELFRTIALSVKLALLPYDEHHIF